MKLTQKAIMETISDEDYDRPGRTFQGSLGFIAYNVDGDWVAEVWAYGFGETRRTAINKNRQRAIAKAVIELYQYAEHFAPHIRNIHTWTI